MAGITFVLIISAPTGNNFQDWRELTATWFRLNALFPDSQKYSVRGFISENAIVKIPPVFEKDFEVTGPVSLELYVSSSALDTDFTAKLVDVWLNGYAQNLTEGILRMRYHNTQEHAENMQPGKIYSVKIDLVGTSNGFLAGHKLRLEISSSNFPRFDRNLNTGEEQASGNAHRESCEHSMARPVASVCINCPSRALHVTFEPVRYRQFVGDV